jgi:signal transduction histidine kinase
MAIVLFLHRDSLARPYVAWGLVGAALAWTIAATVLMERNPPALERFPAIGTELLIGMALSFGGGVAYAQAHSASEAFDSVRTIGFAWPLAGIIAVGVVYGAGPGVLAGFAVALPRFFAPIANGITFHDYHGSHWYSLASTTLLYALAGGVGGFMATTLRRAQDQVAAANARERVARTLHDGVLQTLAIIERRADDPQLAQLAREQERELREFLFGGDGKDDTDLGARIRHSAARFEDSFGGRVEVVLAPDLPKLTAAQVDALAGAVGEALVNAGSCVRCTTTAAASTPRTSARAWACRARFAAECKRQVAGSSSTAVPVPEQRCACGCSKGCAGRRSFDLAQRRAHGSRRGLPRGR